MINNDILIRRDSDFIDRSYKTGVKGFKYTKKVVKLGKGASKVAELFTELPKAIEESLVAVKSFKFIGGLLAVPKLAKSTIKVIKTKSVETRLLSGWKIVKSIKKIVGAVETVFYYLKKLNLISKAALAWTTVAGYIFFPVSFISAGLSTYDCGKKAHFLRAFRGRIKNEKMHGTQAEVAKRITEYIGSQRKTLEKLKIITKKCPLKYRLNAVLTKINSRNREIQNQGIQEAAYIRKRLKDRITEHVGVAAVDTAIAATGVATTIVGLTCPPAAPALTIAGLGITVIKLANFAYSKFIPTGDILEGEKRMLFARIAKGARNVTAKLTAAAA